MKVPLIDIPYSRRDGESLSGGFADDMDGRSLEKGLDFLTFPEFQEIKGSAGNVGDEVESAVQINAVEKPVGCDTDNPA
ncbi:MAG: hypothetical protein A4E66_02394 [Syntrophus sp. PtaB.Bin001]|nr:MAG: hypothetical protein A4E66_02394 [Syntrophus sp. PtaB.Bin001]